MQLETKKIVAVFHKGRQFCENCRDSRYKVSGILIPQRILAYLGLIAYAGHDSRVVIYGSESIMHSICFIA